MGMGFRVGSGVRVYGGGRGLGVSVGKGPLHYYQRVGGGGGRSRGPSRTSIAAHERQVRQAQRFEEIQGVLALDQHLLDLCQVHKREFVATEPWVAADVEPVDARAVEQQLKADAVTGISAMRLGERRAAKREAASRVSDAVRGEEGRREAARTEQQAELDRQWALLQQNDPQTVLAMLEAAFADNEAPAAGVSCRGERIDVVMRWPDLDDVVPERKGATTPSGQPTIHKRTKTERAEFYLEALSSNALVTAKEALAVCPEVNQVGIAVIRARTDPARGDQIVEAVLLGTATRDQLAGIHWQNISAIAALLGTAAGKVGMKGKGSNKTLFGLDLSDDAETQEFIATLAEGLEARVAADGVPGIALPVNVVAG
jgi:hypothetical protein